MKCKCSAGKVLILIATMHIRKKQDENSVLLYSSLLFIYNRNIRSPNYHSFILMYFVTFCSRGCFVVGMFSSFNVSIWDLVVRTSFSIGRFVLGTVFSWDVL
jgi:hypothetical protein